MVLTVVISYLRFVLIVASLPDIVPISYITLFIVEAGRWSAHMHAATEGGWVWNDWWGRRHVRRDCWERWCVNLCGEYYFILLILGVYRNVYVILGWGRQYIMRGSGTE